MAGLQLSQSLAQLPDRPDGSSTFFTGGTDKLDVTAFSADVKVEIQRPDQGYEAIPLRVRAGLHKSFAGLSIAYKPNGIVGFRLSIWTPGAVASADIEAYST